MARVTWQDGAAGGTPINADNLNKINLDVTDAETRAKARANHTGTQAISTVTGLQAALDSKANVGSGGGAVDSVAGKTGVVTLTADDMTDGTTNKVLTAADKTKLGGIATGATANLADANLLARANHTGTQDVSTIVGLQTTLNGLAPKASPTLTGTVVVPTATSNNAAVNKGQMDTAISSFAGSRTLTYSRSGALTASTGTGKVFNDSASNWTITSVRATVGTAPTGASIIIDVNLDGTSIFGTQSARPTIGAGSVTSGKATGFTEATIPPGGSVSIDIDQIGSTVAGSDLVVQIDASPGAGGSGSPATTSPRPAYLTVASASAPADVRASADFTCDGTDDQQEINSALQLATRAGDGFGGQGWGEVRLLGQDFSIADNNTTSITMFPNTRLRGSGDATLLTPKWASSSIDRGCIELYNDTTSHVQVADLGIGRFNAMPFNGHGVRFFQTGNGDVYEIKTGNDPYNSCDNVLVRKPTGHGIYCLGTGGGGSRESQIRHCRVSGAGGSGIVIQSSSDSRIIDCTANGSTSHGFVVGGGNTKILGCKAFYNLQDGYLVSSSRCEVGDCAAQDNGINGFNFTGSGVAAGTLSADSNMRLDQSGSGFRIASSGIYSGLNAFDRNQTPSSQQTVGIRFVGSPQVSLLGMSSVPSGNAVVGSAGANSFVRIVVDGAATVSLG